HDRRLQLCVEELESRLVPSTLAYSTNWSGYAVTTAPGAVTKVTGQWTVPAISASQTQAAYSATWVGIDGTSDSNPTVEQIGTESDSARGAAAFGTPQYYAWFEMYPGPAYYWRSMTITPGDHMSATVAYVGSAGQYSHFSLSITDDTSGVTRSTTQSIRGAQRASAEWVVEAPSTSSGVLPLA